MKVLNRCTQCNIPISLQRNSFYFFLYSSISSPRWPVPCFCLLPGSTYTKIYYSSRVLPAKQQRSPPLKWNSLKCLLAQWKKERKKKDPARLCLEKGLQSFALLRNKSFPFKQSASNWSWSRIISIILHSMDNFLKINFWCDFKSPQDEMGRNKNIETDRYMFVAF